METIYTSENINDMIVFFDNAGFEPVDKYDEEAE